MSWVMVALYSILILTVAVMALGRWLLIRYINDVEQRNSKD